MESNEERMTRAIQGNLPRPAWIEVDLRRLRKNYELINEEKPPGLQIAAVVKDEAYGHGALAVAQTAIASGARFLAVATLQEAVTLREQGIKARILMIGDRDESEFEWCVSHALTCCVSDARSAETLGGVAARANKAVPVHIKINTGMNRYGVRWTEAAALAASIANIKSLVLEGVMTHFAQSDESDKTFAQLQIKRFEEAVRAMNGAGVSAQYKHLCNSGGFLDLPQAHGDMVRLGILPLGVYPSSVCRRIPGIEPVMSVRARIVVIQNLQPGDSVGYGMRYTAPAERRIAVLPIGYGDGYPRVRNQGHALTRNKIVPLVGGVAMDALTVDITDVQDAQQGDEVVLMGRQGDHEISVHDIAKLKNSVSYDVLAGWRARLTRVYLE